MLRHTQVEIEQPPMPLPITTPMTTPELPAPTDPVCVLLNLPKKLTPAIVQGGKIKRSFNVALLKEDSEGKWTQSEYYRAANNQVQERFILQPDGSLPHHIRDRLNVTSESPELSVPVVGGGDTAEQPEGLTEPTNTTTRSQSEEEVRAVGSSRKKRTWQRKVIYLHIQ
eukprot:GHVR01024522.1.p4 GENE.GHVR01024522.1~~GHVR01024522.1.p4  ORF type:complete len:169 (-),score=25.65 GHVR01024522.1:2938-3444(-)